MKGLSFMPWKELGKSQFSPTWIEIIKQNVTFSLHGSNSGSFIYTEVPSWKQSPVFLTVFVVRSGVFPVVQSSTKSKGNEENPDKEL